MARRRRHVIKTTDGKTRVTYSHPEPMETAAVEQPERATMPRAEPKYLGGGWYEVNGRKVRKSQLPEE